MIQLCFLSTINSNLTFGCVCWGGNTSRQDRDWLEQTIRKARGVIGKQQETLTQSTAVYLPIDSRWFWQTTHIFWKLNLTLDLLTWVVGITCSRCGREGKTLESRSRRWELESPFAQQPCTPSLCSVREVDSVSSLSNETTKKKIKKITHTRSQVHSRRPYVKEPTVVEKCCPNKIVFKFHLCQELGWVARLCRSRPSLTKATRGGNRLLG